MKSRLTLAAVAAGILAVTSGMAVAQGVVTVYAADGLHNGDPSWLGDRFAAFTKETGVEVQFVEAGSSTVADRVAKEKANTQADVLITLPPFINKSAADGMLAVYVPPGAEAVAASDKDPQGRFHALVNNYPNFIYNGQILDAPPKSYEDLLDPKFKQKLQYSTPGQAGDGTAFLLQLVHAYGSKDAALDFLKRLQENNLGPSSSTGKLTALVNKGEIYVANGDMQMNLVQSVSNPNIRIFIPEGPDGTKSVFPLPYYIGLVQGAPHEDNGKKLIDFLMSTESQELVSVLAHGLPGRSDIQPTDDNYKALHAILEGVEIWTPDWDQVLADLQDDIAAYNRVVLGN